MTYSYDILLLSWFSSGSGFDGLYIKFTSLL